MTVELEEVVVFEDLEDLEKLLRVLEEEDQGGFCRCWCLRWAACWFLVASSGAPRTRMLGTGEVSSAGDICCVSSKTVVGVSGLARPRSSSASSDS